MTLSEAHAALLAAFPGKSVMVQLDTWTYSGISRPRNRSARFNVSVVPGLGGKDCSCWHGTNVAEAVEEAVNAAAAYAADAGKRQAEAERQAEEEAEHQAEDFAAQGVDFEAIPVTAHVTRTSEASQSV